MKKKYKILILGPDLNLHGGVSNYYNTLNLDAQTNIDYFPVNKPRSQTTFGTIFRLFINYIVFGYKVITGRYKLIHINPSLVRKSFYRDSLFLIISHLLHKKTLVFFRGWFDDYEQSIKENAFKAFLFRISYARADKYIVLSSLFKQKLLGLGVPVQTRFYIESTVADESYINELDLNKKFNTYDEKFVILFLARIEKAKGIYVAIDAYKEFLAKKPEKDSCFIVAGDGPDLTDVMRYVDALNIPQIRFMGNITGEMKKKVLLESHVMLFPSYTEGLPNCVLEGMLYGMPIISRAIGGIPDIIHQNINGFLSQSLESSVFAEFLSLLAENKDLFVKISRKNNTTALEKFTTEKVRKRILTIYDDCFPVRKVLITTPDTSMLGGVAAFYKNLNLETYNNVSYFLIQNDADRTTPLRKILKYPAKFLSFFWKCSRTSTIVINPSFERRSILRDALYLFIAKNIYKRRTIVFWHGWIEEFEEKVRNSAFYKFIVQKHYGTATQTIVLSDLFRNKLNSLGYTADHNFYISSVAADDSYISSFSIEEKYADMKIIKMLFLSRIVEEKGIFRVIEIMDQLVNRKGIKNIRLCIAGDGSDTGKAKRMVKEKKLETHIEFLGIVENFEKARVLFGSHILIFPTSFCEGMPVSILESMLFGLYIITSRRGGIINLVGEESGCMIDELDCDGYVDKIIELVNDPEKIKRAGRYNYAYSMNNYTSSIVKQKLYSLFNETSVN